MKGTALLRALSAAAGLLTLGTAHAMLSFTQKNEVLMVQGKAETGDADRLQAALTPGITTLVLRSPDGNNWQVASALAEKVEKAKLTTVAHGSCETFTCAMMFLAGQRRMFSGAGRPEMHYVSLLFGDTTYRQTEDQTAMSRVVSWWEDHTALSGKDLLIHRDSIFSTNMDGMYDRKVFFAPGAQHSLGAVLHCSGERAKKLGRYQYLSDCMTAPGSALQKKIITTEELFTHEALTERADITPPPATQIAGLDSTPIAPLSEKCIEAYKLFLKQDSPRAFVVGADQSCKWANAQVARPYEVALYACRNAKIGECRFYAIDDKVVFVPFDQAAPVIAAVPAAVSKVASSATSSGVPPYFTPTLKPEHVTLSLARDYSKDAGLQGIADQFTLEGKVVLFANISWEPADWAPGLQHIEVKWFKGNQLIRTQRNTKVEYKRSPGTFWATQTTVGLGEGQWRAEFHANGVLLGSKTFTISSN
ncbi:hypothetical protein [Uliginosibacterium aquaticum]|uniref:Uncharacterized protein n=1 Tax=Uliginosibacterium aquaticum TaxID=2731212 RepID=A0ABX2IPW8_9RHOO|nr:hypothetical protein [Uliginosibacterium aquaticum]NSL57057.1 hypothetical protein [Uliginosibacterium aquaticum]